MSDRGRRARRRRRILVGLGAAAVLVVLAVVGAWAWYTVNLRAADGPNELISVEIPEGSSTAEIAAQLEAADVIRSATAFTWHVRLKNPAGIEAGRYEFRTNSSAATVLAVLGRGPLGPEITRISIPEGFRLGQIRHRITEAVPRFTPDDFDAALAEVRSPLLAEGSDDYEGLLFPATYEVTPDDTVADLLQRMADTMTRRVQALAVDPEVRELGLSDHDLVTVASLVQAEAGNPDEAAKIARVIYNRLAVGQPLGIDATTRYLSIISGDPVDFESDSPYNTRRQPGLPPTPIGAPGAFALEAAARPAEGDWLWYVLAVEPDDQGRPQHIFTESVEAFEEAKAACHEAGLGCGPP